MFGHSAMMNKATRGCYIETGDLSTGTGGDTAGTAGAEAPVASPEPGAGETPFIQREDFANAPFLRKQQVNREQETGEKKIDEGTLDTPVKTEPAEGEKSLETPLGEVPTAFKLADGREVTPEQIAEWEKGYMMQADYSRKTQKLAEERRQLQKETENAKDYREQADKALGLWQSFERDPIGTINQLQQYYENNGIVEPKDTEVLAREDRIRQLETEINTREQQSREQAEQQAHNWLVTQLGTLSQKHGEAFNGEKVMQFMLDNNILDPEKAYKVMTHDDSVASLQKQMDALKTEMDTKLKAAKGEAIAEYVKTKTAKSEAPLPVGASSGGGSPIIQINQPKSFQDARKSALARLSGASG